MSINNYKVISTIRLNLSIFLISLSLMLPIIKLVNCVVTNAVNHN